MSWLTLQQVADAVGGELRGENLTVESISTDTRENKPDALFIALKGERFDAHEALESAGPDVARGLLVQRAVAHPAPQIVVDDTLAALGRLAAWWRQQFTGKVIGLTGSNGKTTVKEMIAAICACDGETLATEGNLNNHIGMPLTLLRLSENHQYAVIEMGANHPGEIHYLTRICRPDVALLNNAGAAHLEGFGSLEGVASAKAEIFNGLGAEGVAIINRDDEFAEYWLALNQRRKVLTFGENDSADIRLNSVTPLVLDLESGKVDVPFHLLGQHNALNAAAAAATSLAAGLSEKDIIQGLSAIRAVPGRLRVVEEQTSFLLIDDSYNANPKSMKAAVDVLVEQRGATWFVMGDMAELGEQAEELHQEVARYAAEKGVTNLLATGSQASAVAQAFGVRGMAFADIEELITRLKSKVKKGDAVLVKGSRAMRMERVVTALTNEAKTSTGGQHAA